MRCLACALLLAVLSPLNSSGQTRDPKCELFAGYSYRGTDREIIPSPWFALEPSAWENANGWGLSFTRRVHNHIGITADFAGQYAHRVSPVLCPAGFCPQRQAFSSCQFLFGPRFSLRSGRVTEFAHALFGVYDASGDISGTDFAMGFGGGVNVKLTERLSVRAFQTDYIPVKQEFRWRHHLRLQTGIVFTFGRR